MDAEKLFMAAADIYIGGTVPGSGGIVSVDANGVPTNGGTNVGATGGPAVFRVGGDIHEFTVEQALSPVGQRKISEVVELEFVMKQIDFGVLTAFLNGSKITTNIGSTPKTHTVTGGGGACVDSRSVTLVAAEPCGATKYYTIITLYDAYMSNNFEMSFAKEAESMVTVILRAKEVLSRVVEDRTYQIVQQFA